VKLSNFKLIDSKKDGHFNYKYTAEVDVTTGHLWWRRTERKKIFRERGWYWFFVDTGEYTPGTEVEKLSRAWKAQTGEDC
jgi:hypothetical protein